MNLHNLTECCSLHVHATPLNPALSLPWVGVPLLGDSGEREEEAEAEEEKEEGEG